MLNTNSPRTIRVSAPGSMMVMGEHAVLHGHGALVMAINKRIYVNLTPRDDQIIQIGSELCHFQCTVNELQMRCAEFPSSLCFVVAALFSYAAQLEQGFTLQIHSEFSHQMGFGSSAAVVVATLGALRHWCGILPDKFSERSDRDKSDIEEKYSLLRSAHTVIKSIQGIGSGADVAASVFGGLLYYRPQSDTTDYHIETLIKEIPFIAFFSGSKTPTPEVILQVNQSAAKNPVLYQQIYNAIGHCTQAGLEALQKKDLKTFGQLMNTHHTLLGALGVSNQTLEDIFTLIKNTPTFLGGKISGAGLGDCMIALGNLASDAWLRKYIPIPIEIAHSGCCYE